jgi:hypothetical protein
LLSTEIIDVLLTLALLSSLPLSYVSITLLEDDDFKTSRIEGIVVRPPG